MSARRVGAGVLASAAPESTTLLEFSLDHAMRCSPERFWTLYLDPDFTRSLILDGLGFGACEIERVVDRDSVRTRSMRVTPKLDLPAVVAKLLGPRMGYTEHARLDTKTMSWSYEIVLSVLSDRIRMGGKMHLVPDGEHCRRISKLWCEIRIFGVGGLVEKAAEKNMRDGWNRAAVWMNDWYDAHPA
ncbi:MAG: DUF2505 domain-containing protein [Deltaproteobacteria bacterium]|nr:DUF2505 domain-containing protein [Nannocystaceae bacterium]